jgi:hypothetical protein
MPGRPKKADKPYPLITPVCLCPYHIYRRNGLLFGYADRDPGMEPL